LEFQCFCFICVYKFSFNNCSARAASRVWRRVKFRLFS